MMRYFSVGFALGLLLTASPIWAASSERHSGVVVAADPGRGTITIDEMGPWYGPATAPARRVFQIAPGTRFGMAERTPDGNLGWPWAYTERSLELSDLRAGDFVTITTCAPELRPYSAVGADVITRNSESMSGFWCGGDVFDPPEELSFASMPSIT